MTSTGGCLASGLAFRPLCSPPEYGSVCLDVRLDLTEAPLSHRRRRPRCPRCQHARGPRGGAHTEETAEDRVECVEEVLSRLGFWRGEGRDGGLAVHEDVRAR
jgi:hypothetical protein